MISVILPCYNEKKYIFHNAVESILNQTYRDIELIIILDKPDNVEIRNSIHYFANRDHRVKPIINEKNLGIVTSLNKGIMASSGEYIARMDADDISFRNRLAVQLTYLEEHELDFIGAHYINVDEQTLEKRENKFSPTTHEDIYNDLKYYNCFGHPLFFFKRHVFYEVGGYEEVEACEDYHFVLKVRDKHFKMGNVGEVLLLNRHSKHGISRTNEFMQRAMARLLTNNADDIYAINVSYLNSPKGKAAVKDMYLYSELIDKRHKGKFMDRIVNSIKLWRYPHLQWARKKWQLMNEYRKIEAFINRKKRN